MRGSVGVKRSRRAGRARSPTRGRRRARRDGGDELRRDEVMRLADDDVELEALGRIVAASSMPRAGSSARLQCVSDSSSSRLARTRRGAPSARVRASASDFPGQPEGRVLVRPVGRERDLRDIRDERARRLRDRRIEVVPDLVRDPDAADAVLLGAAIQSDRSVSVVVARSFRFQSVVTSFTMRGSSTRRPTRSTTMAARASAADPSPACRRWLAEPRPPARGPRGRVEVGPSAP